MTIDEYLNQLPDLKRDEDRVYTKLKHYFDKATSTPGSSFDGMPRRRSHENMHETWMIEYADAKREWTAINNKFYEVKEQLESTVDYLLYWEGRLIYQLYIYNVILGGDDPMDGAEEILHTQDRDKIDAKLDKAKSHLRQLLIKQGVELE